MLPICYACLRTDRKLRALNETLANLHDELCDFGCEAYAQFCSECEYMLRKFQNFKEKCQLGVKILKLWKKQKKKDRTPISLLATEMPPSNLSLCNPNNCKVFFHQDTELVLDPPAAKIPCSKYPQLCIKPIEVELQNDFLTDVKLTSEESSKSLANENDMKDENLFEDNDGKENILSDSDELDTNYSFNSTSDLKEIQHSITDYGLHTKTQRKATMTLAELARMEIDLDSDSEEEKFPDWNETGENVKFIRRRLDARFSSCGELVDEKGNAIDKAFILESLDKMSNSILRRLWIHIVLGKTLTGKDINLLSQLQKRYKNEHSDAFDVVHLPTEELVSAEFSKRKEYKGYLNSDHRCEMCFSYFKHKKMLDYHLKTMHNEQRPLVCSICQMRFINKVRLRQHQYSHRTVFKCKICPMVTSYRLSIETHYRSHLGEVYTCAKCQATFKTRSGLALHMIKAHPTSHKCNICGRNFANAGGLRTHYNHKHSIESEQAKVNGDVVHDRATPCDKCDATFVSDTSYRMHLVKIHGEREPNASAPRKRYSQVNPKKYVCPLCKVVESSYGAVASHFKSEHPHDDLRTMYRKLYLKHLCHICGKGFRCLPSLRDHKNVHTGAKPYACDKCPAKFYREGSLRDHHETHQPRRRECPQCGKKFVSASNLNAHMRIHIGTRRYKCDICPKRFLHAGSLTEHVRGVHRNLRRKRKARQSGTEDDPGDEQCLSLERGETLGTNIPTKVEPRDEKIYEG